MKLLTALFLLAQPAFAAGLSLSVPVSAIAHPIRTFHHLSGSEIALAFSVGALEAGNAADYATTYRGVIRGSDCELNPLFQSAACGTVLHNIDAPRFTGVKIGIAALPVAEYLSKPWRNSPAWNRVFTVINFGGAAVLGSVAIHNAIVLEK